jgi:hypothetical protein
MSGEWGVRARKLATCHEKLRLSPDALAYQWLREGPAGNIRKQKNKKYTFKAGMYMKTKDSLTNCPKKVGHLCIRFGHFCPTDTHFAEIRRELR